MIRMRSDPQFWGWPQSVTFDYNRHADFKSLYSDGAVGGGARGGSVQMSSNHCDFQVVSRLLCSRTIT
jgi:hypothetical protein